MTVDSEKLEYGSGTICDGFPSFLGVGVGGQSYSNFVAAAVIQECSLNHAGILAMIREHANKVMHQ